MAIKPGRPKKKTAGKRKYRKAGGYDFTVLFIVLTLVLFGVVMIFSSSYYYTMTSAKYEYDMFHFLKRQSVWAVLGIIAMFAAMNVPYNFYKKFAFPAYMLSNLFLCLLPVIGIEVNGQKRWLGVGSLSFQPSEFTKVAVIWFLSVYVIEHRKELANIKGFIKACGVLLVPVVLIAVSNFSSALLVGLVGATILFVASPRICILVQQLRLQYLFVVLRFCYLSSVIDWGVSLHGWIPGQILRVQVSRPFSPCMR